MWSCSPMVILLVCIKCCLRFESYFSRFFFILVDINKLKFQRDSIKVVGRKRPKLKGLGGKQATA